MSFFYEHFSDKENFFLLTEFDNCWVNSHFHKSYEFVYVKRGRCEIFVNDAVDEIDEGDIFCVPSYCVHYLKSIGDTEILTMVFSESYFDDFIKDRGGDFFPPVLKNKTNNKRIFEFMKDFHDKTGDRGGDSYLRRKIFIDSFLALMLEYYAVAPVAVSKRSQNLCDILAYIDTHFAEKLDLKTLAEKFGYNQKYFSAYFNKYVGSNITSYINTIRFNNAKYLLENTDKSVSEVAAECGFESLATFYRIMKKYSVSIAAESRKEI